MDHENLDRLLGMPLEMTGTSQRGRNCVHSAGLHSTADGALAAESSGARALAAENSGTICEISRRKVLAKKSESFGKWSITNKWDPISHAGNGQRPAVAGHLHLALIPSNQGNCAWSQYGGVLGTWRLDRQVARLY